MFIAVKYQNTNGPRSPTAAELYDQYTLAWLSVSHGADSTGENWMVIYCLGLLADRYQSKIAATTSISQWLMASFRLWDWFPWSIIPKMCNNGTSKYPCVVCAWQLQAGLLVTCMWNNIPPDLYIWDCSSRSRSQGQPYGSLRGCLPNAHSQ